MCFELNGDIVFKNRLYSNAELTEEVGIFQVGLNSVNISRNKPVGLVMKRTPHLLTVIFALLNNHISFLPLDVQMPSERIEYMLKTAEVSFIISDILDVSSYYGCKVIHLDKLVSTDKVIPSTECGLDEIAYLLFTSGTTGVPKAVEVRREGLLNFIEAIPKCVVFPARTRIACVTNATFDIFFLESVMALCCKMTVVLADEKERSNPRLLKDLIKDNRVNVLQMTPSMLFMLGMIDEEFSFLKSIDVIMLGGEEFPKNLLKTLQKTVKGRIYNMYGPTETTIWSSVSDLTNAESVNIGYPIANTEIYIVENGTVLKPMEEGEIAIAGTGLARGYCNNKEKTEQSFVVLTINNEPKRVYLTGDLGYVNADGTLFCCGRKDLQVKILGHRIELGDVEENIRRIKGVDNAAVVAHGEEIKRLICFYIGDVECSEKVLEEQAKGYLPSYMIPSMWIKVDEFIYTSSKKIDRKAMLSTYYKEKKEDNVSDSNDEIFDKINTFFAEKNKEFNIDADVEEIITDSLGYIEFIVFMEECMNVEADDEILDPEYFKTIRDVIDYFMNKTI